MNTVTFFHLLLCLVGLHQGETFEAVFRGGNGTGTLLMILRILGMSTLPFTVLQPLLPDAEGASSFRPRKQSSRGFCQGRFSGLVK